MKELSTERPVIHIRKGYHETGYAFHFVRCLDKQALRDYVKVLPRVEFQEWFEDDTLTTVPAAVTVCLTDYVIPGSIPEAAGKFMCDIHMVVIADSDPVTERRQWYHEIGHAVKFAFNGYREALIFGFSNKRGEGSDITEDDVALFEAGRLEFSAYCNEFLCCALDKILAGDPTPESSGFPFLFPWLGMGGEL